jgi:hydroxyethylthiazole kinase-like sugar kinase family protein
MFPKTTVAGCLLFALVATALAVKFYIDHFYAARWWTVVALAFFALAGVTAWRQKRKG